MQKQDGTAIPQKEQLNSTKKNFETLERLSRDFSKSEVKQRQGRGGLKLDYISIDSTINRFNEVFGLSWSFEVKDTQINILPNQSYSVVIIGNLVCGGASRSGVGGSTGTDLDDTIKTAMAEAVKKAGNLYGVGLYLWDEAKRQEIADYRELTSKSVGELQKLVSLKLTSTELSAISKTELRSKDKLIEILSG